MTDDDWDRFVRDRFLQGTWTEAEQSEVVDYVRSLRARLFIDPRSIPLRLNCPECGELHVDQGEFRTKPHHTHACQKCGLTWRPAIVHTVGVRFLPGFKDEPKSPHPPQPPEGEST